MPTAQRRTADHHGPAPAIPTIRVADITRTLTSYLDLGYEVRQAADGWATLVSGSTAVLLVSNEDADHVSPRTGTPAPVEYFQSASAQAG
ncbi:hypothetical protein GCM10017691_19300 [Pseudonocardia petroleophila]